jgi:orotidine-5'-phosphate decarboxylase
MPFDAITVAPYMGQDSVTPFLAYPGKWTILLALTSNAGSGDFQQLPLADGGRLFEKTITGSQAWAGPDQLMYVVGATRAEQLADIRKLIPDHFLLVPGVGAQGGDLEAVTRHGINRRCGLLVNSSRAIIYAADGTDFARQAGLRAQDVARQMAALLDQYL